MSDDLLERATRALRDTSAPSADDLAETRARILAGTRAARVQRARTLRWVLPLAAAFVAGSAFAATNGQVERALETVGAWLRGDAEPSAAPQETRPRVRAPKRAASPATEEAVVEAAPTPIEPAPAEQGAEDAPAQEPASDIEDVSTREVASSAEVTRSSARASHGPRSTRNAQDRERPAPAVLPRAAHDDAADTQTPTAASASTDTSVAGSAQAVREAEPSPVRVANPDLAAYREAHRLHFGARNFRAALNAWDLYLARFPAGTFSQEARYNRAICLVRLGRVAEARAALAPFARGEIAGGYRKQEAQALLEALERTP